MTAMQFSELLELAQVLGGVLALSLFFFFYFRNDSFREKANGALKFLPSILGFAASRVEDKKGEFDAHDILMVMSRVSARIQATIQDPENKEFEDVQDEVFEIVRDELAKYEGMKGVPDLDDPVIKTQVRVVFEGIQRAASANPAGNDS
jgi:hypothetical protein